MTFLRLAGAALLLSVLLACGTGEDSWLSEQAPYRSDATVTPAPQAPTPPHSAFTSVSVGGYGVCGLRADGSLSCREPSYGSTRAPQGPFRSVSVGGNHACGVREDGSVACWGYDYQGQATPPEGAFASVSAGGSHSCGVRDNGSLACWGDDEYGQATPPEGAFASVSASGIESCGERDDGSIACGSHSCGVRDDGSLACWGYDEHGEATPPEGAFASVSAGGSFSCGVRADGSVACWGNDEWVLATPPEGPFASVSIDWGIACGLRENRTLVCWHLLDNPHNPDSPPLGAFTQGRFISVSMNAGAACGVREDGSLTCSGDVPGRLATPTLSITDRTSGSLTVEWGEPWVDPEGERRMDPSGSLSYQLHAGRSPEGPYRLVMSGLETESHVVVGLQPGTVHYLALLVCDEFECSQVAAVATTESDGPVNVPSTPTGFRGKKIVRSGALAADDAKLNWEAVTGATYYELWKGSDPDLPFEFVVQVSVPLEAQSFEIAPNRGFFGNYELTSWKVRACNKAGCSPFTDIVTIE